MDYKRGTTINSVPSAKSMASVFWNCWGVIFMDLLIKDRLLKKKNPRLYLDKNKDLFHQDNACVHTSIVTPSQTTRAIPRRKEVQCNIFCKALYSKLTNPFPLFFTRIFFFTPLKKNCICIVYACGQKEGYSLNIKGKYKGIHKGICTVYQGFILIAYLEYSDQAQEKIKTG